MANQLQQARCLSTRASVGAILEPHPAISESVAANGQCCTRVQKALDLGCDLTATETSEAVEGDAQHSYHNIKWAGFEEAYLRDNYVLAS
jgi:hypothetical protein